MSQRADLWLFGYGSLVWRPDFEHRERRAAVIDGWTRRFWQGSPDHRGVPEAPGRVVTLVPEPGARCHGVAYRVAPEVADHVIAGLDHRERGGYVNIELAVQLLGTLPAGPATTTTPDPATFTAPGPATLPAPGTATFAAARMYLATPDNPNYLGPAPLAVIARQILRSHGPSGANVDYLLRLAESLRELAADDEHVFALERELRRLQAAQRR